LKAAQAHISKYLKCNLQ